MNFADQIPRRCPHIESVAAATIDVAIPIELDPVWNAHVASCEYASISQEAASVAVDDVEGVDRVWVAVVWGLQIQKNRS